MLNYIDLLKKELLEQFRGKKNIEDLVEVLGIELQQVYGFLVQLRSERGLMTSFGKQLDGIGDIVDMSRAEVYQYLNDFDPPEDLTDEIYRQYLIYKILINTSNCTYKDIIKAFKMFWDRPLYYSEDPNQPATMIFDTGVMEGNVDTRPLFRTPPIRAAGITLKLFARTSIEMETTRLHILSGLGYAVTVTDLPVVERDYQFNGPIHVGSSFQRVTQDTIPILERNIDFGFSLHVGANTQSISQSPLPAIEKNSRQVRISSKAVHSVLETPIGEIQLQN